MTLRFRERKKKKLFISEKKTNVSFPLSKIPSLRGKTLNVLSTDQVKKKPHDKICIFSIKIEATVRQITNETAIKKKKAPHFSQERFLLVFYRRHFTLWSLPLSWLKWISSSFERSSPLEGLRDSTSVKAAINDWIKWVHGAQAWTKQWSWWDQRQLSPNAPVSHLPGGMCNLKRSLSLSVKLPLYIVSVRGKDSLFNWTKL